MLEIKKNSSNVCRKIEGNKTNLEEFPTLRIGKLDVLIRPNQVNKVWEHNELAHGIKTKKQKGLNAREHMD